MLAIRIFAAAVALLLPMGRADVRGCACDLARPETLSARECSLCGEAEKQPAGPAYFFLKDRNPNKPNRMLALPRLHGKKPQDLAGMTTDERTAYWTAAIAKARELWGDGWALAINSLERRTQCHMHIHIDRLIPGSEDERFVEVDGPAQIPLPADREGLWVHPTPEGKLHAHHGIDAPELLLEHLTPTKKK
jgi:CDP-diacylglycerol pyrophosphatase